MHFQTWWRKFLKCVAEHFSFFAVASKPSKSVQDDEAPFRVSLSEESFETYDLDPLPETLKVTKKQLKSLFVDMWKIRYGTHLKPSRIRSASKLTSLITTDDWKWRQTDYTKNAKSEASVTSL